MVSSSDALPPAPRPAASLILLRSGEAGLELVVGRRGPHLRAFPGATVFPGGKLDPQDALWPGAADDAMLRGAYAALREMFEETGVLLAADGSGAPLGADVFGERARLERGEGSFAGLVEHWGRRLDPGRLTPFARRITPETLPYRFDTLFFLAAASPAEAGTPLVATEIDDLIWAAPAAVLDDPARRLEPPTRSCLERLAGASSPEAAIAAAVQLRAER